MAHTGRRRLISFSLFLLALAAASANAGVKPNPAGSGYLAIPEDQPPQRVSDLQADYPGEAVSRHMEGWVLTSFIVLPDGTTADIEVLERSTPRVFDASAVEAVSRLRYAPAIQDGVPVEAPAQLQVIFYKKGEENRNHVSRFFMRRMTGAMRAMADQDMAGAKKRIDKLADMSRMTLAEDSYYHALLATYHSEMGEPEAAARHIDRALMVAEHALDRKSHRQLLLRAVELRAAADRPGDSIEAWYELARIGELPPVNDPVRQTAESILARIAQPDPIVTELILEPCATCENGEKFMRRHALLRKRIVFNQMDGGMDPVTLSCGDYLSHFVPEVGETYLVPPSTEDCTLRFSADSALTVTLSELPMTLE